MLLDMGLPDTDGVTLARQFRKLQTANKWPLTPLIALTAHEHLEGDDLEAFDSVFTKPFSLASLNKIKIFLNGIIDNLS